MATCLSAASACGSVAEDEDLAPPTKEQLGALLFADENLSANRTQACATCHDPDFGFADPRQLEDGTPSPASLGDDEVSVGDRNAPTASYARFAPPFSQGKRKRFNTDGDFAEYRGYLGGLFHDGRATGLEEQAAGPPLNPIEMGMSSKRSVLERLREAPNYVIGFKELYGSAVWDDPTDAYEAMTDAIAAFERTQPFAPFDSRYDRSLLPVGDTERYVYQPDSKAAAGKALFFSTEFTNCAACHQLHAQGSADAKQEVFTGFEYHNLGVPENVALRRRSGASTDLGLGGRLNDETSDGKFKTPTLRNVAVTGPYMHNGIFQELSTVLQFYEHAKRRARGETDDSLNPESNSPWREPEVARNLSDTELASGNKDLSDQDNILALECFLMSLTDARFEPLLNSKKVKRCGL